MPRELTPCHDHSMELRLAMGGDGNVDTGLVPDRDWVWFGDDVAPGGDTFFQYSLRTEVSGGKCGVGQDDR